MEPNHVSRWYFDPVDQCVGEFEDSEYRDNYFTKWVGFDKHKKLLYGVRKIVSDELPQYEVVMMSIFGGDPYVIQTFEVDYYRGCSGDFSAISKSGETICVWIYSEKIIDDEDVKKMWENYVYKFSVERGKVEKYKLRFPLNLDGTVVHSLLSFSFDWICCVYKSSTLPECYMLYRLVFDDFLNLINLEFITEYKIEYTVSTVTICEYKLFLFCNFDDFLHVYDFRQNSWCKQRIQYKPNYFQKFFAVSEDMLNIFGAIEEFTTEKTYTLCKLTEKEWEKTNITFNCDISLHHLRCNEYRFKTALCTKNLLFLNPAVNEIACFINFDVLSLQDIAAKKILDHCRNAGLLFEDVVAGLNLPNRITRMYFGPTWLYENDNK